MYFLYHLKTRAINIIRTPMSSTNETPRPIRIWEVQQTIEDRLRSMKEDELKGAEDVLSVLHSYLYRTHFQEQKEIDVKALVKTVEELWEISAERLYHEFQTKGYVSTTTSEN